MKRAITVEAEMDHRMETNKRIARRFLELVSAYRLDDLCALVAPTWRMYGGPRNLPAGPDGVHALFGTWGNVQQRWTIDSVVAEGDLVVVRATNDCVMDDFMGIDGRGKHQHFSAMFMHRIVGGQIQETWRTADDLGRLLQLGARLVPGAGGIAAH